MSMSDDEPYDADGDVSRFLHCPSPEAHLFPLSEPEGTLVGICHNAPAATTDEVQGHQQAPHTLNAAPDLLGRHHVPTTTEFQGLPVAPQTTLNAAAPDFGLQQPPTIIGFQAHPTPVQTLGVAPDFGHQAPTTEFQGHPAPDFGLPAPAIDAAEHYQAPIINAEQYQASAMEVDHQYYQPMAVDNIQPTTQMLAREMHDPAYGGFPDPTPMLCDGVDDEASLLQANMLANGGVVPDPSPSLYEQLINDGEPELAAIIRDIERGDNAAGSAAAGAAQNDMHPVKEEIFFRPTIRGQLDCSRCRSVREVSCLDGNKQGRSSPIHSILYTNT
jgi:hypothetical protein